MENTKFRYKVTYFMTLMKRWKLSQNDSDDHKQQTLFAFTWSLFFVASQLCFSSLGWMDFQEFSHFLIDWMLRSWKCAKKPNFIWCIFAFWHGNHSRYKVIPFYMKLFLNLVLHFLYLKVLWNEWRTSHSPQKLNCCRYIWQRP